MTLIEFCKEQTRTHKMVAVNAPSDIPLDADSLRAAMNAGFMVVREKNSSKITIIVQDVQTVEEVEEEKISYDPQNQLSVYTPPSCVNDIITLLTAEKTCNILFYGPTQCGKTVAVDYIGKALKRKVFAICCSGQTKVSHFFGQKTVRPSINGVGNHIEYVKGIVEEAMIEGLDENGNEVGEPGILFIDEAASMPSEVAIGLNHPLETTSNVRRLTLPEDGNRLVKSHSGFRVILAGNTNGTGAQTGASQIYTAQKRALDASVLQRISYTFRFGYDRKAEENIIKISVADKKVREYLMKFKDAVRGALKAGKLITPFSTGKLIDICNMYRIYLPEGSAVMAMTKAVYYSVYESLMAEEKMKYDEFFKPLFNVKISTYAEIDDCDYL